MSQYEVSRMARKDLTEPQRAWVDALRSGKYKQAKNTLTVLDENTQEPVAHCCLGVACEIAMTEGVNVETQPYSDSEVGLVRAYNGVRAILPEEVRRWLGLRTDSGMISADEQLTAHNDEGKSFEWIADLIESRPDGLFVETE